MRVSHLSHMMKKCVYSSSFASFPLPKKHEKKRYIMLKLMLEIYKGWRGGKPQYFTPLIQHSLWLRPRDNLVICPIKARSHSHLTSPRITDSNQLWLAYENPNHWKWLLMRRRYVCLWITWKWRASAGGFFWAYSIWSSSMHLLCMDVVLKANETAQAALRWRGAAKSLVLKKSLCSA